MSNVAVRGSKKKISPKPPPAPPDLGGPTKSPLGGPSNPTPLTLQLEAVAVWVAWAKATLLSIEDTFRRLGKAAADPAHPLHGRIELGEPGDFNVIDHGYSRLCDVNVRGLVDIYDPLGGEKGGA